MTTPFCITEAPLVQIMPLPKGASLAGITRDDGVLDHPLRIDAWIQGPWRTLAAANVSSTRDQFFEDNCHGCKYYFEYVTADDSDVRCDIEYDGEEASIYGCATRVRIASPCPCYTDGLSGVEWPCLAGEDIGDFTGSEDVSFENIRFSLYLDAQSLTPSRQLDHSPWCVRMQGYRSDGETGPYFFTTAERVLNVYDPYGEVCWGHYSVRPRSLADAAEAYASIPGNEDLLTISDHEDYTAEIRSEVNCARLSYDGLLFPLLSDSEHALIYCRATPALRQSFLLLATAQSARIIGDLAVLPATWQEVTLPDGSTRSLWVGDPLPDGHCWLFDAIADTNEGVLLNGQILGQLQLSTPTPAL